VVSPGAVRTDDRDPLTAGDLQVDRSQGELAALHHGFRQHRDDVTAAWRRGDGHLQLPLLARLRDLIEVAQLRLDRLDPARRVCRRLDAGALGGAVVVGHAALGAHRSAYRLLPLALRLVDQS
jgi:hypothetical protein